MLIASKEVWLTSPTVLSVGLTLRIPDIFFENVLRSPIFGSIFKDWAVVPKDHKSVSGIGSI